MVGVEAPTELCAPALLLLVPVCCWWLAKEVELCTRGRLLALAPLLLVVLLLAVGRLAHEADLDMLLLAVCAAAACAWLRLGEVALSGEVVVACAELVPEPWLPVLAAPSPLCFL